MNDSQTKDNRMAKIGLDKLAVEVDPTYAYHTGLSSLCFDLRRLAMIALPIGQNQC